MTPSVHAGGARVHGSADGQPGDTASVRFLARLIDVAVNSFGGRRSAHDRCDVPRVQRRRLAVIGVVVAACIAVSAAPAEANPCDVTQDRSLEGERETAIIFVNRTARSLTVYWLNDDGRYVHYKTLGPDES